MRKRDTVAFEGTERDAGDTVRGSRCRTDRERTLRMSAAMGEYLGSSHEF